MRILVVEDQEDLAEAIARGLQKRGYALDVATNGNKANEMLHREKYNLVILDLILPGLDGAVILHELRRRRSMTPILVLTARSQIEDKVSILDLGADDYLIKPFEFRELEARCRALLRRSYVLSSHTTRFGNLVCDTAARRVTVAEQQLELTGREFQMLQLFLANLGRVLSKDMLNNRLFRRDDGTGSNRIELCVSRLRRKLDGATVRIRTLRGIGYVAELDSLLE